MKISSLLKINASPYELDFIDVDLERDLPFYIDPFLIANINSPWAIETDRVIKNFFHAFKTAMVKQDYTKADQLFQFMDEPKDNCLGVSSTGTVNGKGVGPENVKNILSEIISSNSFERGLVNNIEDLIFFVDNLGRDKMSDMVTNIIRKRLVKYTQAQCAFWNVTLIRGATLPYWDEIIEDWNSSEEELLVIEGRGLLLIPKSIVSPINIFSPENYEFFSVVPQEQQFHLDRNSALVKYRTYKNGSTKAYVTKRDVVDDIENQVSQQKFSTKKDFIRDYTEKYPDLFTQFVSRSQELMKSLSTSEILRKTCSDDFYEIDAIIDAFSNKLKTIERGKNAATEYHRFVKSLLGLIFYPYLINPVIEREIHGGRKRIDIVMDNNDITGGFFFKLNEIFNIFCPYIFIECKNYGKDVGNPEIDQLSGRFAPNRGKFGMLFCRELENEQLFLQRCKDTYADGRGLIIHITDKDILSILNHIKNNDFMEIWNLLDDKKRNIII